MERVARIALHHVAEGDLGLGVVAHREQDLAAAELRLVEMLRARVLDHQAIERLDRELEIAALLVRACQLVQHAIVGRILRVLLQELLVARDRRLVVRFGHRAGSDAVVGGVHLQIGVRPTVERVGEHRV